jgi:hypothetical protein
MSSVVQLVLLILLLLASGGVFIFGTTMLHGVRQRSKRFGRRYDGPPRTEHHGAIDRVTTVADVIQRITGPGSGPYSGTPFLAADDGGVEHAGQARASHGLSDGPCHECGIIDQSRHVSSIGRR